ncbi:MAG TPA: hypothetical protein VGG39_23235 [Polyangiaceae bacterium]|jgi:hypothetical protein
MQSTENTKPAAAPASANTQPAAMPASPPATSPSAAPLAGAPPPTASPPPAASAAPPAAAPAATTPVTSVANGGNRGTKVELQSAYLGLIAGLEDNYQPDDVFELPMGDMTRDAIVAVLASFVSTAEATKASNTAWRQDVQTERVAEQTATPVAAAVKAVLVGKYGKSSSKLLAYAIAPAKVAVVTPAARAAAAAKAAATRKARGTRGSVQKQQITGNVTGVVITPMTAGPAVPADGSSSGSGSSRGNASSGSNGAGAPAATAAAAGGGGAQKT